MNKIHPFLFWIEQIREAGANHKIYFISLNSALVVPDICGALESTTGYATRDKYVAWFDKWVAPKYKRGFDGDYCYGLRNTMLHQGRLDPAKKKFERVAFVEPGANAFIHDGVFNNVLTIDLMTFVDDISKSATAWFETVKDTEVFKNNYKSSMKRYAGGMHGIAWGVPVIT